MKNEGWLVCFLSSLSSMEYQSSFSHQMGSHYFAASLANSPRTLLFIFILYGRREDLQVPVIYLTNSQHVLSLRIGRSLQFSVAPEKLLVFHELLEPCNFQARQFNWSN